MSLLTDGRCVLAEVSHVLGDRWPMCIGPFRKFPVCLVTDGRCAPPLECPSPPLHTLGGEATRTPPEGATPRSRHTSVLTGVSANSPMRTPVCAELAALDAGRVYGVALHELARVHHVTPQPRKSALDGSLRWLSLDSLRSRSLSTRCARSHSARCAPARSRLAALALTRLAALPLALGSLRSLSLGSLRSRSHSACCARSHSARCARARPLSPRSTRRARARSARCTRTHSLSLGSLRSRSLSACCARSHSARCAPTRSRLAALALTRLAALPLSLGSLRSLSLGSLRSRSPALAPLDSPRSRSLGTLRSHSLALARLALAHSRSARTRSQPGGQPCRRRPTVIFKAVVMQPHTHQCPGTARAAHPPAREPTTRCLTVRRPLRQWSRGWWASWCWAWSSRALSRSQLRRCPLLSSCLQSQPRWHYAYWRL